MTEPIYEIDLPGGCFQRVYGRVNADGSLSWNYTVGRKVHTGVAFRGTWRRLR